MDDAFGTFLYIIISIIILVVTGLRKVKANQEAEKRELTGEENMPGMDSPGGFSLEDIFGDRYESYPSEREETKKSQDIAEYVKEKTGKIAGEPSDTISKILDTPPDEEGVSVFNSEIDDIISRSDISKTKTDINILEDVDWKKAVIFSEILNRKY